MKLFMFYVGGDAPGSNIELHDMRFSCGEKPEDCYEDLRRQWWGTPDSLHLDCWGEVNHADGFDVTLHTDPSSQKEKLFFVDLGGYDPEDFSELHKNILVVTDTASKAKVKALQMVMVRWRMAHKDNVMEVEKAICVSETMQSQGWHIHLTKSETSRAFEFICKYKPIGGKI